MTETPLDLAFAATEAAPDDIPTRLRYYARLTEGELFLLLEREGKGDTLDPKVFDLEDGPIVLAFDREDRLTEFTGMPAPYAALPGRVVVEMLAGSDMGLGLNLGVAPSARVFPPEILAWLAETLSERPEELENRVAAFHAPRGLPEAVLTALDARLARMEGLAALAYLVGTEYEGGQRGHMLAFVDAAPGAESALARAVQGALGFSGIEAGQLDVTFLAANDTRAAELARLGLRFDLPQPAKPVEVKAPGLDPDAPPKLR
ncbi:SseB family protein [Roseibaca sp. Y0-43]|uniref:SseB family protein n=1 Tax=Roseibaca sp. Y0-43 TaxID=2816854 RepID=UPI001D0BF50E|nr:SseB family protein [Roseibaca sp. Y0-43]MCC1481611.1 SseB family protein [Roseibaca sp. Y0-43]